MLKTVQTEEEHNNSMMGLKEYMDDWHADYQSKKTAKTYNLFFKGRLC
ncbi:hypothetical protein ACIQ4Z_20155 [Peribacillus asahii]